MLSLLLSVVVVVNWCFLFSFRFHSLSVSLSIYKLPIPSQTFSLHSTALNSFDDRSIAKCRHNIKGRRLICIWLFYYYYCLVYLKQHFSTLAQFSLISFNVQLGPNQGLCLSMVEWRLHCCCCCRYDRLCCWIGGDLHKKSIAYPEWLVLLLLFLHSIFHSPPKGNSQNKIEIKRFLSIQS